MRKILFAVLAMIIAMACQKELSFDDNGGNPATNPLDSSGRLKGWTTTYFFGPGDSLEWNSTVIIDSAARKVRLYDSIADYDEYILHFNSNWKLVSIHHQEPGTAVTTRIDSFVRNAAGKLTDHKTFDGGLALLAHAVITQDDLGDSTRFHINEIVPAPTDTESDYSVVVHKASQRVQSSRYYRKNDTGTRVDSSLIGNWMIYNAAGYLTDRINYSYQKTRGSVNSETLMTNRVTVSNYLDQGKLDDFKKIEELVYGNDLAWFRLLDGTVSPFFAEQGFRTMNMFPVSENGVTQSFTNGVPDGAPASFFYPYSYKKNSKGNLQEILAESDLSNGGFISAIRVIYHYYP
jgi:hypothetical protein